MIEFIFSEDAFYNVPEPKESAPKKSPRAKRGIYILLIVHFDSFLEKNSKSPSDTSSSSSQREPKLDAPKTAKARASGQLRQANNKTPPLIDFGSSTTTTVTTAAPANKKKTDTKKKEWDDDAWDLLNN